MKADFFVFTVGFLFVAFGLGGVENSVETIDLVTSCVVSIVGLMVMWVGTLMINRSPATHNNPTLR